MSEGDKKDEKAGNRGADISRRACRHEYIRSRRLESETADAGAPVEGADVVVVLSRIVESAVIHRIDGEVAIIAPTVARLELGAGAIKEMGFTLTQRVYRVRRQSSGVAELREDGTTGNAKANGQISFSVHRRTAHKAPV